MKRFITKPGIRIGHLAQLGFYNYMSDEKFLKKKYKIIMGRELPLDRPQTFNEKLQWLKLHDRKTEYTTLVDKYQVRGYIKSTLGERFLIPLLGGWESPDDIDFESLPNQFVLKCNHNSGRGMCVCTDKNKIDIPNVKKQLRKGLKENYYIIGREWPYKDVKRRIIAEKYMIDNDLKDTRDYKIHCFNGEPKYIQVVGNRNHKTHTGNRLFYDFNWKRTEWGFGNYPPYDSEFERPLRLDSMYDVAKKLSHNHMYIRVDLYEINGEVYFGELTFFPQSGLYTYNDYYSYETDLMLGNELKLEGIDI